MRINRFIARATGVSRRKADELIKEGRVKVNGKVLDGFVDIGESDVVEVDGKRVQIKRENVYFAFNKPPFVISSTKDENGRKVVCDFFENIEDKLICVGRLDYLSEGLLIVTNDGKFANILMHPKFKIRKTYLVKTKDIVKEELLKKMTEGTRLEDGFFKPLNIKKTNNPNWLVVSIDSGRNRILRRFFKKFGGRISRLKRIAIGPIELGDIKPGKYRDLTKEEINIIKKMVYRKNAAKP